ncbi:unnamed protein product [Thelazia callipaeda]|uniref:PH domain-containing protein n=1 Tax=Thelazia callipaeda TaxID=103827 RepID=A0A0N5DA00_THECL|nr:unnamed protein product [Thelazia callipaeda]
MGQFFERDKGRQNPSKCGLPFSQKNGKWREKWYYRVKIMGGQNVKFGEHPWTVALLIQKAKTLCTDSL